jgi:hypothetical protein
MVSYNLDSIYEIQSNMKDFELPNNVENTINLLIGKLGINVSRTRIIKKERTKAADNQWVRKEPFKVSVFEKSEGINEYIDEMRGIMNKITKNNYDTQYDKLIECIDKIWEGEFEDVDDKKKQSYIIDCLTNVIINNRFYAELYAKTFSRLSDKYISFDNNRNKFIDKYNELSETFVYVNPDEDYDKFCSINKTNEQRKALLAFLIYAVSEDIYSFNILRDITLNYFELIDKQKLDKEFVHINEEIVENIFVVFSEGKTLLLNEVSRYELLAKVKELSSLSTGQNPGITNRIRFKCMDISDLYK